jgi:hypothetical protein
MASGSRISDQGGRGEKAKKAMVRGSYINTQAAAAATAAAPHALNALVFARHPFPPQEGYS